MLGRKPPRGSPPGHMPGFVKFKKSKIQGLSRPYIYQEIKGLKRLFILETVNKSYEPLVHVRTFKTLNFCFQMRGHSSFYESW